MTAHVLVVEDNELVGSALRVVLEDGGYRVTGAGTIAAATAVCREDRPDVMLLDLKLPDGDGLSLIEQLTGEGTRPSVVAVLTGRDEPQVRDRCIGAGCRAVLVKPVPTQGLVRMIREWLEATGEAD
jgi:CheY-like chemotaxis protein